MSEASNRLVLESLRLSVELAPWWKHAPEVEPNPANGTYLRHPGSVLLKLRRLQLDDSPGPHLAAKFAAWAERAWRGPCAITVWNEGPLQGVLGEFEQAIGGEVVREWWAVAGSELASAACFAPERIWQAVDLLPHCERLVRSIQFHR